MHKEADCMDGKYSEEEIRNFIKKHPKKCDDWFWFYVSYHQEISQDFIREFQDKVHWGVIALEQKLSENFIREFQERFDWITISRNQDLSEDFIRELQDKVCWFWISRYQNLSEKFLIEFIDKIDSPNLKFNEKIPEKVKNRIILLKKVRNA